SFFSSRRRHTISLRDWSSDVCSSDLTPMPGNCGFNKEPAAFCETFESGPVAGGRSGDLDPTRWSVGRSSPDPFPTIENRAFAVKIGRASCRERGYDGGGAVAQHQRGE